MSIIFDSCRCFDSALKTFSALPEVEAAKAFWVLSVDSVRSPYLESILPFVGPSVFGRWLM